MKSLVFATVLILFSHGVTLISTKSIDNHYTSEKHLSTNGDDHRGFINIDCGTTEPDSSYFQSDAAFIDTGINREVSPDFLNYKYTYLNTVRSFPDGDRNCYTLKPPNCRDNSYLIRAHFMYGIYDDQNRTPVFDVYVGLSFWETVTLSSPRYHLFLEMVYKPSTDFIYICLINIGQGTPFISALFLRPLNNSIYNSNSGPLYMLRRYNAGIFASVDQGYASYSDDIYDRFWDPLPQSSNGDWEVFNTGADLNSLWNDAYEVPLSILKGGARPAADNHSLYFHYGGVIDPGSIIYAYWHLAETQKLAADESREFNIFIGSGIHLGPITLKYMEAVTVVAPPIRVGLKSEFWFSINQTNASSFPPIINAFEFYKVTKILESATNQNDVDTIMDIQTKYGPVNGWHGDPCIPAAPWNGLNCSNKNANSLRITSLNLASRGLTGEILPSLSLLTSLIYLNLSHNRLTGKIPEFLAEMPSLAVIDLRDNMLSGSVPVTLMNKVKSGLFLSVDGNPDLCTSNACMTKSKKHTVWAALVASAALLLLLIALAVFCSCKWKRKAGLVNTTMRQWTLRGNDGREPKSRKFTYSEVMSMTNNLQKIIGKGGSGTVYHGVLKDGTEVAIKILNGSSALSSQLFQIEAELLMRVHHRNLVSLVGYCDEGSTMALIYEYMANGNLQERLSGEHKNGLNWKERLQISIDAAEGLQYLHGGCKPAIIHRDLKTANILLDDRLHAKLADFGMSRIFSTESASHISTDHLAGTLGYLDPEYYGSYKLNEKGDVYSFGVILLELITGRGAVARYFSTMEGSVHIVKWVLPLLERGDIDNIIDARLQGDFSTASAWKALETAMACVPSTGIQRPSMDQVLVDLKECLAIELAHERAKKGAQQGSTSSNQAFDIICAESEFSNPRAR